jgi:hypothetical protein
MNLEEAIAHINSGQPVPQNDPAWVAVAVAAVRDKDPRAINEMSKWGVRPVLGSQGIRGVTRQPGTGPAGDFAQGDFLSQPAAQATGTPTPTPTATPGATPTAVPTGTPTPGQARSGPTGTPGPTPTPGTGATPRGEAGATRLPAAGGTRAVPTSGQDRAGPSRVSGVGSGGAGSPRIGPSQTGGSSPIGGVPGSPTLPVGASGPMSPANPNDPNAGLGQVPTGYMLRDLGITEAGLGELDPYSNEGSAQILRLILGNNGLGNTPLAQYLSDDAQGAAILNLILGGNLLAGTPGREPVSRSQQLMGMEDILERSYGPNQEGQYYDPSAILGKGLEQAGQYPLGSGGMDDVTGGYADQADLVGYSVGAAAPYMDPLSAAHMASSFGRARQSYDDQWLMGKTQGSYIDFLRQLGMM